MGGKQVTIQTAQALRTLLNEAYGACAWLEGIVLSDRARAYKAKKLREALVNAEICLQAFDSGDEHEPETAASTSLD